MTTHVHDPATQGGGTRPEATPAGKDQPTSSLPRWLVPGLLVALVAGVLVAAGVVPLSVVFYAAVFGGMILMHAGGHGGHGGGHGGHGNRTTSAEDLSQHSSDSQSLPPGSATGLEDRAIADPARDHTDDHDQRNTPSCH